MQPLSWTSGESVNGNHFAYLLPWSRSPVVFFWLRVWREHISKTCHTDNFQNHLNWKTSSYILRKPLKTSDINNEHQFTWVIPFPAGNLPSVILWLWATHRGKKGRPLSIIPPYFFQRNWSLQHYTAVKQHRGHPQNDSRRLGREALGYLSLPDFTDSWSQYNYWGLPVDTLSQLTNLNEKLWNSTRYDGILSCT